MSDRSVAHLAKLIRPGTPLVIAPDASPASPLRAAPTGLPPSPIPLEPMTTNDPFEVRSRPAATAIQKRGFHRPSPPCSARCSKPSARGAICGSRRRPFRARPSRWTRARTPFHGAGALAPASTVRPARDRSDAQIAMHVREELRWLSEGIPGLRVEVVTGGHRSGPRAQGARAEAGHRRRHARPHARPHPHRRARLRRGRARRAAPKPIRCSTWASARSSKPSSKRCPKSAAATCSRRPSRRRCATPRERFQRDALHLEGTRLGAAT